MGEDGSTASQERDELGSLATIPASSRPVSDHFLKEMHLILNKDIEAEFCSSVSHVHKIIDHIEERTDQILRQMEEATHAYN